jgi:predicted DNA-binding protein
VLACTGSVGDGADGPARGYLPAMGRKKESTTVYFDLGTLQRLRALSDRTRVPVAVYVREAVEEWLSKQEATSLPVAREARGSRRHRVPQNAPREGSLPGVYSVSAGAETVDAKGDVQFVGQPINRSACLGLRECRGKVRSGCEDGAPLGGFIARRRA